MPRTKHPARTLSEIFADGRAIGEQNTLLNDAELGRVLAGSDVAAYAIGSIANMRMTGRLSTPVVRVGRTPKTRLSDALAFLERRTERAA
ncbi:MAG: hypothetical protein WBG92_05060 [Thiohalocapsa sp.]